MSAAVGRTITYTPIDQDTWIAAVLASGVPRDYAAMLRLPTSMVANGNGSRPNNDVWTVTGRPPISFTGFASRAAPA